MTRQDWQNVAAFTNTLVEELRKYPFNKPYNQMASVVDKLTDKAIEISQTYPNGD